MSKDYPLFTNYGKALIEISRDPEVKLMDIANALGVTERAAQRIVTDLRTGGYISSVRVGRRSRYKINGDRPIGEIHDGATVLDFLGMVW